MQGGLATGAADDDRLGVAELLALHIAGYAAAVRHDGTRGDRQGSAVGSNASLAAQEARAGPADSACRARVHAMHV